MVQQKKKKKERKRDYICGYQRWAQGEGNCLEEVKRYKLPLQSMYILGMYCATWWMQRTLLCVTYQSPDVNPKSSHHKQRSFFLFLLFGTYVRWWMVTKLIEDTIPWHMLSHYAVHFKPVNYMSLKLQEKGVLKFDQWTSSRDIPRELARNADV